MDMNDIQTMNDAEIEKMFLGKAEYGRPLVGMSREQAEQIVETMVEYKELRMMYTCVVKEVRTKFEVLNTEFSVRYQRNPINFITSRVKSTHSIFEKMNRQNLNFTLANLEERINDVAGIRVICSYVDDIYRLADALIAQDDIQLLDKKDYIEHPKPNGYRSLHLIVSVPVFFAKQKKELKVEVQIRTIAMDFWASLEHQIKYKKQIPNQQEVIGRLKICADVISETDMTMMDIRRQLEDTESTLSEDFTLLEKIKCLDEPIL